MHARHVLMMTFAGLAGASVAQAPAPDLEAGRASVRWIGEAAPDPALLVGAIKRAGYTARQATVAADHASFLHADWHLHLWLGGFVTAALMLGEWVFDLGLVRWFQWLSFALASGVQTFCGAQFYRGAWRQLQIGRASCRERV